MPRHSKDIVVIGGGVIGCSIAYYLAKKGIKPLIIERKEIASEASCAAAGGIWPQSESSGPGVFLDLCLESKKMFPALSLDRVLAQQCASGRKGIEQLIIQIISICHHDNGRIGHDRFADQRASEHQHC